MDISNLIEDTMESVGNVILRAISEIRGKSKRPDEARFFNFVKNFLDDSGGGGGCGGGVCVRPFMVKASSVWISWTAREQINDVVLKTFISYAKSFHRYFRMKRLTFQTSHFILLTH